jgi:hypothetical protein
MLLLIVTVDGHEVASTLDENEHDDAIAAADSARKTL